MSKVTNVVTPDPPRRRGGRKKPEGEVLDFDDENDPTLINVQKTPIKKGKEEEVEVDKGIIKETHKMHENAVQVSKSTKECYKIVQKMTGSIGGNGYNGAIYGELTVGSMQRVINILKDQCKMDHTSRFIDVGAGLGKPNFHASQDPQVRLSLGIELELIRWQLSMHNLLLFAKTVEETDLKGHVNFICNDIDEASTLDPFTHVYMYDLGFPPPLQQSIARKFNKSVHAEYLISYRPPRRVQNEYGYQVEFLTSCGTSMFGSGEGHTAYFYKKIPVEAIQATPLPSDNEDDESDNESVENKESTSNKNSKQKKNSKKKQETKKSTRQTRSSKQTPATSTAATDDAQDVFAQPKLILSKREGLDAEDVEVYCDPLFLEAARLAVALDVTALKEHAKKMVDDHLNSGRSTRRRAARTISDA